MADVVDASVVIADYRGEALSSVAVSALGDGLLIAAPNLAEVASWLVRNGHESLAEDIASDANVAVVPFTEAMALAAGQLALLGREFDLSLADRCCLATAKAFDAKRIFTTDRAWLDLPEPLGSRVVLARPA